MRYQTYAVLERVITLVTFDVIEDTSHVIMNFYNGNFFLTTDIQCSTKQR